MFLELKFSIYLNMCVFLMCTLSHRKILVPIYLVAELFSDLRCVLVIDPNLIPNLAVFFNLNF